MIFAARFTVRRMPVMPTGYVIMRRVLLIRPCRQNMKSLPDEIDLVYQAVPLPQQLRGAG